MPYRYVGANIWYGAWLGADTAYGDRARLGREPGSVESARRAQPAHPGLGRTVAPKNSITPGFRDRTATYNEDLLKGLDWTLAEMAKRDMTGVIYLTNFGNGRVE
ncbi:hypothetical protein QP162_08765 [Sphingomonas aurantiaca]|uniref:hypothetical protein n=1 Tax=Sphingomonas aurantiaca TaxID=185949 RepID=UPI002FDF175E